MKKFQNNPSINLFLAVFVLAACFVWIGIWGCSHPSQVSLPTASGIPLTPTPIVPVPVSNLLVYDGEPGSKNLAWGSTWVSPAACESVTEDTSGTLAHSGIGCMVVHLSWGTGACAANQWWGGMGWNFASFSATSTHIIDITGYKYLYMCLRGAKGGESNIQIAWNDPLTPSTSKNAFKVIDQYLSVKPRFGNKRVLETYWECIYVPTDDSIWGWTAGQVDRSRLWQMIVSSSSGVSGDKTIYLDDIWFVNSGTANPYAPMTQF